VEVRSNLSVILALVSLIVVPIHAESSDPVAAYSFSEGTNITTADVSGNGNTAALVNGPAWTTPGRYGHGLLLDGVDDKVQVTPTSSLDLTTALTFESWVCPTSSNRSWTIVRRNGSSGTTRSEERRVGK